MNIVTARAAALRILAARNGFAEPGRSAVYSLAEFQQEAVDQAHAIMHQRGGVIIADSVGLGKTYIGAALIERELVAGHAGIVAVVVPAGLRAAWRRALQPLAVLAASDIELISHARLSRGFNLERSCALVVVDEAHAFRNPRTRRYRALRRLARSARVALLTATPVNNSLADLYFQIRICAADDAFTDLGIGSLAALLRADEVDSRALRQLTDAILIRRTRAQLRHRFAEIALPTGEHLRFPAAVELVNVLHQPIVAAQEIELFLDDVQFAAYGRTPTALLGLALLKRLQSSRAAGLATLERVVAFQERFLDALAQGRFLRARSIAVADHQLCFAELLLPELPAGLDAREIAHAVQHDLAACRRFRERLAGANDTKLPALIELLDRRNAGQRTLVFTEFRDTADQLWKALRARWQVALITGTRAYLGAERCGRAEVIRRFAPRANGAPQPSLLESVSILIATDVLAEGLNLQDADAVVSYDLPWNPVRLIQRVGRIDRIGSDHDRVVVYNFMPDREFEHLLGLVRRLRHKLRGLHTAIGQEQPVLEPHEITASFYEEFGRAATPAEPPQSVDYGEAGPVGCSGSTTVRPKRVLQAWRFGQHVRELIIQDNQVLEDKAAADRILELALASSIIAAPPQLEAVTEAAKQYLPSKTGEAAPERGAIILARAVQRAIKGYGVLAEPDLIAAADELIGVIRGNVYEPGQLQAIRSARTQAELKATMLEMIENCRVSPVETRLEWQLIASLGSD